MLYYRGKDVVAVAVVALPPELDLPILPLGAVFCPIARRELSWGLASYLLLLLLLLVYLYVYCYY